MMSKVVAMSTNLSPGQTRFKDLLEHVPWLAKYWDWDKRECDYDVLMSYMGTMSHGEKVVTQFFLGVWTHNDHDFDILEAASILDIEIRQLITDWFMDPFWP